MASIKIYTQGLLDAADDFSMEFTGVINSEDEMEVEVQCDEADPEHTYSFYLRKEDAIELIEHLKKHFKI